MSPRLRHGMLTSVAVIALMLASVIAYAGSVTYEYDELNRLKKVTYEDERVIQYTYDGAGNRIATYDNTIPPITTADPPGGLYNSAQSVTLTCTDMSGFGCNKICYTTDGTTPTTSSPVYSSPINISVTTTLKFFARDLAGNSEAVKSEKYTISTNIVTVQLKDSTGNPISGGVVQYYSGGWQVFGTMDASGRVSKELQPETYTFSMTYGFARQEKSQNVATNPTVVFQTGQVHSDSGSCINYYARGWRVFIQDIELLPVTYTFRFNDGTFDRSYTIITGTVNHIH